MGTLVLAHTSKPRAVMSYARSFGSPCRRTQRRRPTLCPPHFVKQCCAPCPIAARPREPVPVTGTASERYSEPPFARARPLPYHTAPPPFRPQVPTLSIETCTGGDHRWLYGARNLHVFSRTMRSAAGRRFRWRGQGRALKTTVWLDPGARSAVSYRTHGMVYTHSILVGKSYRFETTRGRTWVTCMTIRSVYHWSLSRS